MTRNPRLRAAIELAATVTLVVATVVMLVLVLTEQSPGGGASTRTTVSDWRSVAEEGIWIGSPDARVVVTEFVDFQCPFCRASRLARDAIPGVGNEVAFVYHHFPLDRHQHALEAAVAAECADRVGSFDAYARQLFLEQDSIGVKPWQSFAEGSVAGSLEAFAECLELPIDSFPRIARGRALGAERGVQGTPTVWVNGVVVPWNTLPEVVDEALRGAL